jgi:hypothetical protein
MCLLSIYNESKKRKKIKKSKYTENKKNIFLHKLKMIFWKNETNILRSVGVGSSCLA